MDEVSISTPVEAEHYLPFLAGRRWIWKVISRRNGEVTVLALGRAWTRRSGERQVHREMAHLANMITAMTLGRIAISTETIKAEVLKHGEAAR